MRSSVIFGLRPPLWPRATTGTPRPGQRSRTGLNSATPADTVTRLTPAARATNATPP